MRSQMLASCQHFRRYGQRAQARRLPVPDRPTRRRSTSCQTSESVSSSSARSVAPGSPDSGARRSSISHELHGGEQDVVGLEPVEHGAAVSADARWPVR